jgi:DNA/RNA-binding domain of Phe-tRNA-synthetase-like protein
VLHQLPLGGEDLTRYSGPPHLVRAIGSEPFDTVADSAAAIDGVTCRRWNWRQTRRTQLHADTTTALFILDALDPMTDQAVHAAAEDLITHLGRLGPDMAVASRLIAADKTLDEGA